LAYIVILLLAGVFLVFLETLIPSGGMLSVLAAAALVAGVVLGFMRSGTTGCLVLIIVLVCVPMFVLIGLKVLPRTLVGRKMLLTSPSRDSAGSRGKAGVSGEDYDHLLGKTGITVAPLRPSGIAEIDGKRYSVAAEGEMIERGCEIIVIKVEGNNIVVEPKERNA
jgi:membrane-bound serine protease (ClpP class)